MSNNPFRLTIYKINSPGYLMKKPGRVEARGGARAIDEDVDKR